MSKRRVLTNLDLDTLNNKIDSKVSDIQSSIEQSVTDTKTYVDEKLDNFSGVDTVVNTHNAATDAHSDIRELISTLSAQVNNFLDVDDATKDQLSEVLALISDNADVIEGIRTAATGYTDEKIAAEVTAREAGDAQTLTDAKAYIDNLVDTELQSNYDLWLSIGNEGTVKDFLDSLQGDNGKSAYEIWLEQDGNAGKTEEDFIDAMVGVSEEQLSQVLTDSKAYTDTALANFSGVEEVVNTHNTATDSHSDIRETLSTVSDKVDTVTESDATKVSFGVEQELTDDQKNTARTNIGMAETSGVKFDNVQINYFVMKDAITGCEYFVTIENRRIVYNAKLDSLEITKMPDKMIFYNDETLEGTGIEITAHYQDGTSEVITDYVYEMVIGSDSIDISYTRNGVTCTVKLEGVIIKSVAEFTDTLIDFVYTDNGDGTFTLTDWKGTYNGVASNRIIIPNSERIKL